MLRTCLFFFLTAIPGILSAQTTKELIAKNLKDQEIVIPGAKDLPGIGDNEGEPPGKEFKLPPGIRIVDRPGHRFDPDISKLHGIINTFYAVIHLVNDNLVRDSVDKLSAAPVLVEFPPGFTTVFIGESRMQNGALMDRERVNIPPVRPGPGGKRKQDTITVYLGMACLNAGKGLPWAENINNSQHPEAAEYPVALDNYRPGRIIDHKGLQMLFELLSHYPKLKLKQHYNPQLYVGGAETPKWMEIYNTIQEMVWKVTDGPGITRGELENYKKQLQPYK